MKRLIGCEAEGDLDFHDFIGLVYPADRAAVRRCMLASQRDEEDRHRIEFRVQREDGSIRWLLDCGRAFFEKGGGEQPSRVMGTVLDVTERKQVEERQLLLMAELDHRVKNILANVGAIAKLSSRRTASVEEFVTALDARIRAVAKAHSMLRRDSWIGISLDSYVRELLEPFIQTQGKNIAIEGEPVYLLPRAAQSLALVVHELATNAVKYGSLSLPEGKVHVAWSRIREKNSGHLKFTWTETDGPPVEKPAGQGFGVTVIRAAASELGADLDYDFTPKGVVLSLEGPIEQVTKSAPRATVTHQPFVTASVEQESSRKCRVLIVEDEAVVALQVKSDLETAGHKVVGLATNVAQGIELAANSDFDVAFLDIRLGDDLSTPVAENLLKRGIPFAFGSGFEDDGILPAHLRNIPRLAKPYKTESISRLLGRLAK
jgi:PAS domain S-box-containing protein